MNFAFLCKINFDIWIFSNPLYLFLLIRYAYTTNQHLASHRDRKQKGFSLSLAFLITDVLTENLYAYIHLFVHSSIHPSIHYEYV